MRKQEWLIAVFIAASLAGGLAFARRYYRDGRAGVPDWELDKEFSKDVFTFVRIRYSDGYGRGGYYGGNTRPSPRDRIYGRRGYGGRRSRGYRGWGRGGNWATDYPDSDLNFSYRLQQLTSMEVDPNGLVLELTDPELFNYPFIYMLEVGRLVFSDEEVKALRKYLLNGGFLMVDDFWGEDEWYNFYCEIKRVFPNLEPQEIPYEHDIFHCVFELKERPQIPSWLHALEGRAYGRTWERSDAREVHYKAIYDEKGRIMVIICHNTDLG
ncbi:MAG: DUF4159 domain-containing protein, partial [Phycisphaerales bacterium]